MIKSALDWFDDRTGFRQLMHDALYERIPGGPRWRYIWGSMLVFAIFVQFITGAVLWMHYSPSTQTAWESVYYIQHEMSGGWLLRGVHHYMAQLTIVMLALHLLQVVVDGAYRAPREVNYWLGLMLLLVILGLSLTGYLLPWDQKGYWATQVATKIAGITPLVGEQLKALIIGGSEYGNHTLTRFFALHAGVLPAVLVGLIGLHVAMFRKHGITAKKPLRAPDATFFPGQVLRESVAVLAVFGIVCLLAASFRAELGAPANPADAYNAARPEWYFLFLFQFLKLFHGEIGELFGAMVFPGLVFGFMFLMPFVGRWKLGHRFNIAFVAALLLGAGGLTAAALREDFNGQTEKSRAHIQAVALAEAEAQRAQQVASLGIPPTGALEMLRDDPKFAGGKIFARHCANCHRHIRAGSESVDLLRQVDASAENPTASNLFDFGSRSWVAGLLDPEQIASSNYFGNTIHADGEMATWVHETLTADADLADDVEAAAIALSAEAELPLQRASDLGDRDTIRRGQTAIVETLGCVDCHKFGDDGETGMAPDLTGYASRQWLIDFIANPHDERFYATDNYDEPARLMPAFARHPDDDGLNQLTRRELGLIVDWLRADWPRPVDSGSSSQSRDSE